MIERKDKTLNPTVNILNKGKQSVTIASCKSSLIS